VVAVVLVGGVAVLPVLERVLLDRAVALDDPLEEVGVGLLAVRVRDELDLSKNKIK
jgi:hypothetical protein